MSYIAGGQKRDKQPTKRQRGVLKIVSTTEGVTEERVYQDWRTETNNLTRKLKARHRKFGEGMSLKAFAKNDAVGKLWLERKRS